MKRAAHVLVSGVVLGQAQGGVRRHNDALLTRAAVLLTQRGGSLTILAGKTPLPPLLAEHPSIRVIPSSVPQQGPLRRWFSEGRTLRRAIELERHRPAPFDLWHTAHLPAPVIDLPSTITLHDLRDLRPGLTTTLRHRLAPRLLARAVGRARCVFTVSESLRTEIARHFPSAHVRVIPNAGDHLAPVQRALPSDRNALLHVGHLETRKNIELLLYTLALAPDLPALHLIGASKRGEQERLRELAQRLGVADRVRFLGVLSDTQVAEHYARAAAVVIPSKLEGFGIGVVEAQLARAPLAISSLPALREVAGDDVPHFDPADAQGALQAIRAALAADADTLDRHAARAGRFSWDASASLLVKGWCAASDLNAS